MLESVRRLSGVPGTAGVNLYKNNTDGKGASWNARELPHASRDAVLGDHPAI